MRIEAVELRVVALPLVAPFVAAHGTVTERTLVLVRVVGPDGEGWGECAALPEPTYTGEYVDGAHLVLRDHLVPRLLSASAPPTGPGLTSASVAEVLGGPGGVVGHPMAVAALELAVLDAEGRTEGTSLAARLAGSTGPGTAAGPATVAAGAAVGLHPDARSLADEVARLVAEGYGRVKVKIAPGRDVNHVRAAREAAGTDVVLMADANGAYRLDGRPGDPDDGRRLTALDQWGLACLEQPLAADDLLGHATLARALATPICLDESLTSETMVRQALDLGACAVVCVKAPRLGSWLAAARVLDAAADAGVPAWVGGMLDGGIGRRANLALAAQRGASLTGDVGPSARTFHDDVCAPLTAEAHRRPLTLRVPDGPGIGAEVDPDALDRLTRRVDTVRAARS